MQPQINSNDMLQVLNSTALIEVRKYIVYEQ